MVLLSKLEEVIGIKGASYLLSTNRYPKTIHPQGYLFMQGFKQDPFPKFTYSIEDIILEKEIFMVTGENTTVVTYRIYNSGREISFIISPLIACRDFHWLMKENKGFNTRLKVKDYTVSIEPYKDTPAIYVQGKDLSFTPGGCWYRSFEYEIERARGLDYIEDLYNIGYFITSVKGDAEVSIIASDKPVSKNFDLEKARKDESARIKKIVENSGADDEIQKTLVRASDCFVVDRAINDSRKVFPKYGKTILAGYHWLSDWGRDVMIALNGLCLVTNRFSDAKLILLTFAKNIKDGLIPNNFPEWGETPHYNSIDASLWFIVACYNYFKATGDSDFINKYLWQTIEEIISSYKRGLDFGILMDDDGLIFSKESRYKLTWFNARNEEIPLFQRFSKTVEVQALWYNSLRIAAEIAESLGKPADEYQEISEKVKESFLNKFWFEEEGYLYDSIGKNKTDNFLKPNQIIAVALPFSILPREKENRIVNAVHAKLFSPLGIKDFPRTVTNSGIIQKPDFLRFDSSQQQIHYWTWLLGFFIDAYLKVNENSLEAVNRVKVMIEPISEHIKDTGIGFISEYFDGSEPYAPKGCMAQAWSVAEVLRIRKKISEIEKIAEQKDAGLRVPVQEM